MSTFAETNRQAWNNLSAEYNTKPWQQRISQQVSTALQQRKDWIGARWTGTDDTGRDVRLLDYACGTGAITNALAVYVDTIRGIDVSENMAAKYNEAARQSGMTSDHCAALVGDLLADPVLLHLTTPDLYQFDLAVVGLGFHHFEDPALAVQRLAERLKPGEGVLVIVDFLPFHKHAPASASEQAGRGEASAHHTVRTHGFDQPAMEKMYTAAGLEDFAFDVLPEPAIMDFDSGAQERGVFVARGRRAKGVWGKLTEWVHGLQDKSGGHGSSSLTPAPLRPVEEREPHDQFGRRLGTVQKPPVGGFDMMGRRIE